jgi:mismatch-specific thymine-DNA glycosylase
MASTPPPAKRLKLSATPPDFSDDEAGEQEPAARQTVSSFGFGLDKFKYDITEGPAAIVTRKSPRQAQINKNIQTGSALQSPAPSPRKRLSSPDTRRIRTSTPKKHQTHRTASPRSSAKYASPAKYAHLSPLTDTIIPGLLLVFIGVNPGITTAETGHAYAHPSNRFWHLLHVCGLTPERRLHPSEDRQLPWTHGYGHTNIVSRPTKDQGELSKEEMVAGTAVLEEKCANFRPEAVCIVGKGIWEAVWRWRTGKPMKKDEFHYGWQDEEQNMGKVEGEAAWRGSKVFVASSTSGQAASMKPEEKERIWKPLGEWAAARRREGYMIPLKDNPDAHEVKHEEQEQG